MEKMKKNRKGFTIVELVIVIALIAILAAVLIPTFSNVINNAHESNDTIMVKNLNTILNAEEVKGNRAETMQEALDQAEEGGYKVEKLTPASTGDILWDQKSNRFLLVNKKGNVVFRDESVTDAPDFESKAYLYWKITKNAEADKAKGYSLYLDKDYKNLPETMTVTAGLDVGVHALSAVTYQNNAQGAKVQDVIIRTNGGTLTVDAPQDTVRRFGTADKVVIERIASASYHEYGEVLGTIEVKSGHVQVENGAKVGSIIADKSAAAGAAAAEVTAASGSKIGTVVVNDGSVTVTVKSGATVAEVAPGKDVTIDNSKITGITPSQTAIDTTKTSLFAGGVGTEASPYLIATAEQLTKIGDFSDLMFQGETFFFDLIADIDLNTLGEETSSLVIVKYFKGAIDGNGHSITTSSSRQVSLIEGTMGNVTVKNLVIKQHSNHFMTLVEMSNLYSSGGNYLSTGKAVTFENITITGAEQDTVVVMSNNDSSFTKYVFDSVNFVNCVNNVDITTASYSGIFIGGYALNNGKNNAIIHSKVKFVNCINNAKMIGKSVGFFTGNANQSAFKYAEKEDFSDAVETGYSYAFVSNCANNGVMIGTQDCGAFSRGNNQHIADFNANINDYLMQNSNRFKAGNMTESGVNDMGLHVNENNEVVIDKSAASGIESYRIDIYASTAYKNADGTSPGSNYIWLTVVVGAENVDTWKSALVAKITTDREYGTKFADIAGEEKEDARGHKYKELAQNDGTILIVVDINTMLSEFGGKVVEAKVGAKVTYQISTLTENGVINGAKVYTGLTKE